MARCVVTGLREALAGYLDLRRGLGFKLERDAKLLDRFIAYLEQREASTVTMADALAWATLPTARKHGRNAMDVLHDLMPGKPWRPPVQAFSP